MDSFDDEESILLEPGESYDILFRLKVGNLPSDELENFDTMDGLGMAKSQLLPRQDNSSPSKAAPRPQD